jgi:hypothetical protein
MRNVLDKSCRENENTRFMFSNFFWKSHRSWDNVENYSVDQGSTNITVWRAGLARLHLRIRIHTPMRPSTHMHARSRKHAHTHQYVILTVFPQQQCFHECVSVLSYTCIACVARFASARRSFKIRWLGEWIGPKVDIVVNRKGKITVT